MARPESRNAVTLFLPGLKIPNNNRTVCSRSCNLMLVRWKEQ